MAEPVSLESLTEQGRNLLQNTHDVMGSHREFQIWDRLISEWLNETFPGTGLSAGWSALPTSDLVVGRNYDDSAGAWMAYRICVQKRLKWLADHVGKGKGVSGTRKIAVREFGKSNRVFVVHGHNEAAREKVARFLEKLRLKPIILHEQPNKGRTIIEKFTDYADVAFAVVLLTKDDIGGKSADALNPRARQNVVFELGYFIGKLGRERVCALHEPDVEVLSDYSGVLYLSFEGESWRLELAKEMQAVGLPIDMNHVV